MLLAGTGVTAIQGRKANKMAEQQGEDAAAEQARSNRTMEKIAKQQAAEQRRALQKIAKQNQNPTIVPMMDSINTINNQPPGEYLLVASSSRGYKIADREDAEKYIQRRFKSHFRALKRTWAMREKAGLDGQMVLGEEITELKTVLGE